MDRTEEFPAERRKGWSPGGQREADFRGEQRRNDTQIDDQTEEPLYRKLNDAEVKLSYLGQVLMETEADCWCKRWCQIQR